MAQNTLDVSTLVHVMVWCHQPMLTQICVAMWFWVNVKWWYQDNCSFLYKLGPDPYQCLGMYKKSTLHMPDLHNWDPQLAVAVSAPEYASPLPGRVMTTVFFLLIIHHFQYGFNDQMSCKITDPISWVFCTLQAYIASSPNSCYELPTCGSFTNMD